MHMFKPSTQDQSTLVSWGVSVLLASAAGEAGATARRLAGFGVSLAIQAELFDALALLLDDPREADVLVVDCDHYGGLDAGRRAFGILSEAGLRLPIMLISATCAEQTFPIGRDAPFLLRAPVSAVALKIGFESAFPGRFAAAV